MVQVPRASGFPVETGARWVGSLIHSIAILFGVGTLSHHPLKSEIRGLGSGAVGEECQ